ncbi:MAG: hypothetical protein ACKPKO_12340, partial [Candidatus Fonsibacter sp.]
MSMKGVRFREAVLSVASLSEDIADAAEPSFDERELDVRAFHLKQALKLQSTFETNHGVANKR